MKNTIVKRAAGALVMALSLTFAAANLQAQKNDELREARDEAKDAARVLNTMMKKPDDFIPRELLQKAEAIAVFPGVVKGAFIVGGRGGDGVVARRTADGWSVPVFYNMGGASFGAQIGVEKTDYILLFMNEGALRELLDDKLEFGGELSFAAGPVGRTANAATDATMRAEILSWSKARGVFAGVSLSGSTLREDRDANKSLYGKDLGTREVTSGSITASTEAKPLLNLLAKY